MVHKPCRYVRWWARWARKAIGDVFRWPEVLWATELRLGQWELVRGEMGEREMGLRGLIMRMVLLMGPMVDSFRGLHRLGMAGRGAGLNLCAGLNQCGTPNWGSEADRGM